MVDESIQYFTLEEAKNTLPYVRPVVSDIVAVYRRWKDGVRRYEVIAASSSSDRGETDEQTELREAVEGLLRANLELRTGHGKMDVMERLAWSICRGTAVRA